MFWVLIAAVTAAATVPLATPFMAAKQKRKGWALALLCAVLPLILYLWLGSPELL